jgi:hypothetical protein
MHWGFTVSLRDPRTEHCVVTLGRVRQRQALCRHPLPAQATTRGVCAAGIDHPLVLPLPVSTLLLIVSCIDTGKSARVFGQSRYTVNSPEITLSSCTITHLQM